MAFISLKNKIENLLLLVVCFFYYGINGKATHRAVNPRKILILQMAKLGDMVCTTPMFRAVKERYPEAKLYVIGNAINKEILLGNNDVDEYIVWNKNDFWGLVKRLRREKIDFACQTAPIFGFLAAFYLAGIPSIVTPKIENGYCPWETRSYKILRQFVILIPHRMGSYAPREYLRLLEPIDIHTDTTKKYLSFSKEAEKKIEALFLESEIKSGDFLVCIAPAAGNKIKQWPAERFAQVADHSYSNYGAKIIIIGAQGDRAEVLEMVRNLHKETKAINTSEKLNLDELKALMSKMDMLVSVDTGPIYIAESFGIPTVDITGPIDEHEQPPIGTVNRIVNIKNRKRPELFVMNARRYNEAEARRQTKEITTKMVTNEIDDLYNFLKKK